MNMYEHDHSASKGEMAVVSPLIIFKHVGTDTDAVQRVRQAKLGCAPAHKLFELVKVMKKPEVESPRSYHDYNPNGINCLRPMVRNLSSGVFFSSSKYASTVSSFTFSVTAIRVIEISIGKIGSKLVPNVI